MTAPYRWTAGAALVLLFVAGIFGIGYRTGYKHVERKWDADKLAFAEAQQKAILERVANNQALVEQNAADRAAITKAKDDEKVITVAALTKRLRRGPAICSGPAAPTKADSSSSSNDASAGAGLFREDVERDIKSVILASEEAASTARACQAFIRANGMQP